jgi:hypothetical protein
MPIERRDIRFTPDELVRAISSYARQTPGVLPHGRLNSVAVAQAQDTAPVVTATVIPPAKTQSTPIEVQLSQDSILEMMIRFCKEESIPVPRNGRKAARVTEGLLTLIIDHVTQT